MQCPASLRLGFSSSFSLRRLARAERLQPRPCLCGGQGPCCPYRKMNGFPLGPWNFPSSGLRCSTAEWESIHFAVGPAGRVQRAMNTPALPMMGGSDPPRRARLAGGQACYSVRFSHQGGAKSRGKSPGKPAMTSMACSESALATQTASSIGERSRTCFGDHECAEFAAETRGGGEMGNLDGNTARSPSTDGVHVV